MTEEDKQELARLAVAAAVQEAYSAGWDAAVSQGVDRVGAAVGKVRAKFSSAKPQRNIRGWEKSMQEVEDCLDTLYRGDE